MPDHASANLTIIIPFFRWENHRGDTPELAKQAREGRLDKTALW
jgi:hypothetical protein